MDLLSQTIAEHVQVIEKLAVLGPGLQQLASEVSVSHSKGGKLLIFGNGGSAGDAQHLASELVGRFLRPRKGLAALALTTDSSALTSIGNDLGFEQIFARQIEALAGANDVVLGISTSGNSANVLAGLRLASELGCKAWAWTGESGGKARQLLGDRCLCAPSNDTQRIQECHIVQVHVLCDLVEQGV